jgi:hypothetical protein
MAPLAELDIRCPWVRNLNPCAEGYSAFWNWLGSLSSQLGCWSGSRHMAFQKLQVP